MWYLGEVLSRVGPASQSFSQRTSPAYDSIRPSDIAAAIASVRLRPAIELIQAKYISQNPRSFNEALLLREYCHHHAGDQGSIGRAKTIHKIAIGAVTFYVQAPRCRTCRGHTQEFNYETLRFTDCTACSGTGGRAASKREICRLSGLSRSKFKDRHIRCFWEMHQILWIWEATASAQIRRALRK